jgi:hypothetical protein
VEKNLTPGFKPEIVHTRISAHLAENLSKGEFLERVEQDQCRRKDMEDRLRMKAEENEGIFSPEITKKAKKIRGKSVHELSDVDFERGKTKQQLLVNRIERERMEEYTYTPQVTALAKNIKSAFTIAAENQVSISDVYLRKIRLREETTEQKKKRDEEESLALCAKPLTIKCPAYIKRIALSMSAIRAAKQAELEMSASQEKPQWK